MATGRVLYLSVEMLKAVFIAKRHHEIITISTFDPYCYSQHSVSQVERLQSKQKELRSNLDSFLAEYMNQIFSGLFVHRYRDCRAEIRSASNYDIH